MTTAQNTNISTLTTTHDTDTGVQHPNEPETRDSDPNPKRTPLPKFQLFIIFLIQFAEPITGSVIYPFINQLVRDTGVINGDERRTGYYAGVIESVFFFAEALTVVYWGHASDYFGRRPVLLLGPLGLGVFMLSFGLSKNYWSLVVSRCMQGVFNGNIGVSKSMMGEITDSTNVADAFSIIPVIWTGGATIGPIIGGLLSEPVKTWPDVFGKLPFFVQYPYFLPCALAAFIAFMSSAFAFIGLKETLPSAVVQEKKRNLAVDECPDATTSLLSGRDEQGYSATVTVSTVERAEPGNNHSIHAPPAFRDLLVPRMLMTLLVYAFLTFSDMATQVLLPLFYSTSISLGGLGFDPYRIGTILGAWGFINALFQLFCAPWFLRKLGARKVQIFCHFNFGVVLALYPLLSIFARRVGGTDIFVWAVIALQLLFSLTSSAAYASAFMLILDNAPSRASLGAANGLAQAVGSVTRAIAPTVASSLFSISLEKRLLGGNMVFLVLFGISAIGLRLTLLLPKPATH